MTHAGNGMAKRLLLVEDEATLARAVARLLRRAGYEVFLAGTCDEARRAHGRFSLAVFDVDLPDGDGIELAEELLKAAVVRRAVFFSGTQDPRRRDRAAQLGAFIDKSKGFPALSGAIAGAIAREHAKVSGGEDQPVGDSSDPPPSGIRAGAKNREG